MKTTLMLLAGFLILAGGNVRASELVHTPMIEVGDLNEKHADIGVAMKFGSLHTPRMLVAMQFHGLPEEGKPGESYRLFWVEGEFSVTQNPDGTASIPSYDLKIKPVVWVPGKGDYAISSLVFLPVEFVKDVALEYQTVSIKPVAIEFATGNLTLNDDIYCYISATVDFLGFSWTNYLNDKYTGGASMNLLGLSPAIGGALRFSGNWLAGIELRGEVSSTGVFGNGPTHSDFSAELYTGLFEAQKRIKGFVRAGMASIEIDQDAELDYINEYITVGVIANF